MTVGISRQSYMGKANFMDKCCIIYNTYALYWTNVKHVKKCMLLRNKKARHSNTYNVISTFQHFQFALNRYQCTFIDRSTGYSTLECVARAVK